MRRLALGAAVAAAGASAQDLNLTSVHIDAGPKDNVQVTFFSPHRDQVGHQGLYRGSRFDWSSMLTVDLHGRDSSGALRWPKRVWDYHVPGVDPDNSTLVLEGLQAGSGVAGFVEEFGCNADGATCGSTDVVNGVLGWGDAATPTFIKIGAGQFTKPAGTSNVYERDGAYTRVGNPSSTVDTSTPGTVVYTLEDKTANGKWGYKLTKTIKVTAAKGVTESMITTAEFEVTYNLQNTGTEQFRSAHSSRYPTSVGQYESLAATSQNRTSWDANMSQPARIDEGTSVVIGKDEMSDADCTAGDSLCSWVSAVVPGWWFPKKALVFEKFLNSTEMVRAAIQTAPSSAMTWQVNFRDIRDKSVTKVIRSLTGAGVTSISQSLEANKKIVCPIQVVNLPLVAANSSITWSSITKVSLEFRPKNEGELSVSTLIVMIVISVGSVVGIYLGHAKDARDKKKAADDYAVA